MHKQIIFLGAPGSGKGTQASRLMNELQYKHVSTGDLLREEVKKGTELGKRVKEVMASGALVSDDLVLELLKANCDLKTGSYIFDGFPRNIDQAKALDKQVLGEAESTAVFFDIDLGVLKERLVNRRSCGDCGKIYNLKFSPPQVENVCDQCKGTNIVHRKDDKEDAVDNRLKVFKETIGPVIEYYESKSNLIRIDASENPNVVFEEIRKAVY